MKKVVCISCFDYFNTRIEGVLNYFLAKGYETKYLYAGFDHFKKSINTNQYNHGEAIKVLSYKKNLSPQRLVSHFLFAKKIGIIIKKYKPDIIYCIVPPNLLVKELSIYRRRNIGITLIYDIYDLWPESFPYSKHNLLLSKLFEIWKSLRSHYLANADLILCVAESGRMKLLKEAREKPIKIVRPVILTKTVADYKPDDCVFSFCYLGLVNHITDIDFGVKLLGALAKHKRTILHIIGDGQNLEEFVTRLKCAGVEVICHGCVFEEEKKHAIYSMCNMGLSIPREEIESNMPLKAIEYMSAGLPLVNKAKGDIMDIIEESAIGINVTEEDGIKTAVQKMLSMRKENYLKMHSNCIDTYKMRFLMQDYDEIFSEVMG